MLVHCDHSSVAMEGVDMYRAAGWDERRASQPPLDRETDAAARSRM